MSAGFLSPISASLASSTTFSLFDLLFPLSLMSLPPPAGSTGGFLLGVGPGAGGQRRLELGGMGVGGSRDVTLNERASARPEEAAKYGKKPYH